MLLAMIRCSNNAKQGCTTHQGVSPPTSTESIVLKIVTGSVGGAWCNTAVSLFEVVNKQDKAVRLQVVPSGVAKPNSYRYRRSRD